MSIGGRQDKISGITLVQSLTFQSTIYATPVVHHDGCLLLRSPIRIALSHIYGTGQVIRGIYQNEGILALWKGMGPLVVGVMPAR